MGAARRRGVWTAVGWGLAAWACAGCSAEVVATRCVPGVACNCFLRVGMGVQTCGADGSLGECACDGAAESRAAFEACDANDRCGGGTSCQSVAVTTNAYAAMACTIPCAVDDDCVALAGVGARCLGSTRPSFRCYRPCATDADCGARVECRSAVVAEGRAMLCVPVGTRVGPCGGAGEGCCDEGVCNAGLACRGGSCAEPGPATAYRVCSAAGTACSDGTTCLPAVVRATGFPDGNTCTRDCARGDATGCPGYAAGQAVGCFSFSTSGGRYQCMRRCDPTRGGCDGGTLCLTATAVGGERVSVCAP